MQCCCKLVVSTCRERIPKMSLLTTPILSRLRKKKTDPGCVAWRDDQRAGWFCGETGELAPGFQILPKTPILMLVAVKAP